jgi:hypothetical protein
MTSLVRGGAAVARVAGSSPASANTLLPTQAAYIAGFFDGEGSVNVYFRKAHNGRRYGRLTARLSQNDPAVLRWVQEVTGLGTVHVGQHTSLHKPNPNHMWVVVCEEARRFLPLVRPFLIVKAAAVDRALLLDSEVVRRRASEASATNQPEAHAPPS